MITKYMKIFLLGLIAVTTFFAFDVKAKEININSPFSTEKKLVSSDAGRCDAILGDVNDENSTAWLVQKLLNYLKILGPTIAIVLGSLDFAKAVVTSDEESMKKAQNKFLKRIIAAVALFFVPLLTQVLLGLFGITSDNASCGLK